MATICGTVRRCVGTVSRHPIGADRPAMGSHGSRSGLGRSGSWDMGVPTPSQPRHSSRNGAESWGCRTTVSVGRCSSRALVAISQQLGQAAVKSVSRRSDGGRQSAVGGQSAVSGGDSDDNDGGELQRRSFLRTAGLATPAQYLGGGAACTLQDMRHCRQRRRQRRQQTRRRRRRQQTRRAGCSGVPCVVAWCR